MGSVYGVKTLNANGARLSPEMLQSAFVMAGYHWEDDTRIYGAEDAWEQLVAATTSTYQRERIRKLPAITAQVLICKGIGLLDKVAFPTFHQIVACIESLQRAPEADVSTILNVLQDAWQFVPPGSRLDVKIVATLNAYGITEARPRPSADPPPPPDIIEVAKQATYYCPRQLRDRLEQISEYYRQWELAVPGSVRGHR